MASHDAMLVSMRQSRMLGFVSYLTVAISSTGVKVGIAWLSQLCETSASEQLECKFFLFGGDPYLSSGHRF